VFDLSHSKRKHEDTRSGPECQFCARFDSNFQKRTHIDRVVTPNRTESASAHMSEDGYVKHRILEMRVRFGVPSPLQAA
jgi:hypothetical protein